MLKGSPTSVLTLIASSCQDEADRAVFLLLVLRVWWEGLGAVVERDGVLVAGANHGAGVPHGWSWGLVLDLPIIRHLQLGCSRLLLHKNTPITRGGGVSGRKIKQSQASIQNSFILFIYSFIHVLAL